MRRGVLAVAAFCGLAGGAVAEERFPALTPDRMSPEQRRVAEAIASGPRGGLSGPFNAWLRSPEVADRLLAGR
jgi:4-carboxymuconolactone decarboxylase